MSVFNLKERTKLIIAFRTATIPQIQEIIDIGQHILDKKRKKLSKKVLKDVSTH